MVTLTGLWLRLRNHHPLSCPSLHHLWEVAKPYLKLVSSLMSKNSLCQVLVVYFWQRSLTWKLDLWVIMVARGHLVVHLAVTLILRRRRSMGYSIPVVSQSTPSLASSSSAVHVGTLLEFLDQLRNYT